MDKVTILGVDIPVKEQEIVDCNILKVTAGTTGYKNNKWDCRTFFAISNYASTNMNAAVGTDDYGDVNNVSIYFEGETELTTFIHALRFAAKTLEEQLGHPLPEYEPNNNS
jgi:hypothetical protein